MVRLPGMMSQVPMRGSFGFPRIPETRFVKNDEIPPKKPGVAGVWCWNATGVGVVASGDGDASGVAVSWAGGVGVVTAGAGVVSRTGGVVVVVTGTGGDDWAGGEVAAVNGMVVIGGDGGGPVGVVPGDCTKVSESVSSSQDGGAAESHTTTVKGGEGLIVSDGGSIGAVPEITPLSER
jgi:hypothetical protein